MNVNIYVLLRRSYLWQRLLIDLHGQHDRSRCAPVVVPTKDKRGRYERCFTPQFFLTKDTCRTHKYICPLRSLC